MYLFSVLLLISVPVVAENGAFLSLDRSLPGDFEEFFPNDENIFPEESDFQVVNFLLLSSDSGERQALVTLENLSISNRIFRDEHIMCLFADGERRTPLEFKRSFKGREVVSVALSFGVSRFPLLGVYTNN